MTWVLRLQLLVLSWMLLLLVMMVMMTTTTMTVMRTPTTRLAASRETLARASDGPGSGGGSGPSGGGGAGGTIPSSLSRKPHEMSAPCWAKHKRMLRLWDDGIGGGGRGGLRHRVFSRL
jgi:hypothetical protein